MRGRRGLGRRGRRRWRCPAAGRSTFNPVLRRNWASARGGAAVTDSNGREYTSQRLRALGRARPVARHGVVDPVRPGREVPRRAAARRRSTSPSSASTPPRAAATPPPPRPRPTWSRPRSTGPSGPPRSTASSPPRSATSSTSSRPAAGANGVRFVRLSLLSSQGFGAPFRDLSEFGVYGRAAGADTTDPETTLDAGRPAVHVLVERAGGDVRVQGRRGRVRGVHVAARGVVARRRAHVLGPRGRCGRQQGPTPEIADVHGRHDGAARRRWRRAAPPFTFIVDEPDGDVRVQGRRGRVRGVHVAARGVVARWRAHVLGARGRRGRQQRPDARDPDVHGRHDGAGDDAGAAAVRRSRSRRLSRRRRSSARSTPASSRACTSPHAVALPDGEHTFSVRAVDAAGNRDATPETRTFVVDSTAPETGFVGVHPALTRDTTPSSRSPSSPPDATFECQVDDGAWARVHVPAHDRCARGRAPPVRGPRHPRTG